MYLVICLYHFERHGKVVQRIGGKKDRAATVMDFVETEHTRKLRDDESPVLFPINLVVSPEKTRMNIAQRQRQAIVLLHAADHQPVRHAIANEGIGHGVAHLIGVAASVRHTGNGSLEKLAALASCLIDADFGLDPRATVKRRHMMDTSAQDTLAFAFLATVGTGIILGLNRVTLNIIVWVADPLGESHAGSS